MTIRKSFTYEGQRHFIRAADLTDYEVKKALLIQQLKDVKPVHLQKVMGNINHMSQSRIDKVYQCPGQILIKPNKTT